MITNFKRVHIYFLVECLAGNGYTIYDLLITENKTNLKGHCPKNDWVLLETGYRTFLFWRRKNKSGKILNERDFTEFCNNGCSEKTPRRISLSEIRNKLQKEIKS